jgi:hypothetical protein
MTITLKTQETIGKYDMMDKQQVVLLRMETMLG